VVEALKNRQGLVDNRMRGYAIEMHDRAETTGIVLELPVVETADVLCVPHGAPVYSILRCRWISSGEQ
jgi:hypothetical protein